MFTPSNMLQNYLNQRPRDMYDIIGALMGYINADPAFKTDEFDQAVQYVLNHGVSKNELFADFNPSMDYEEDSSKWNEEYYSMARVYLKDNFSEKRIRHVKDVARRLYPGVAVKTGQEVQRPVRKAESISDPAGGSQSAGKKVQGQQHQNNRQSITPEHPDVKISVPIVIAVLVLLTLVIAVIIKFR